MIHEMVGWKRWVVGGVTLPFRNHKRLVSGASATDNPTNGSTDLVLGGIRTIEAGGTSYAARGTLLVQDATASTPNARTVRVAKNARVPMFEFGSGVITAAAHASPITMTISDDVGFHVITAWISACDHADPSHVAYWEGMFGVKRNSGGLSGTTTGAYGVLPLGGYHYDSHGLGYGGSDYNVTPYYTISGDDVVLKVYWQGDFEHGVTQVDVTMCARILTRPGT